MLDAITNKAFAVGAIGLSCFLLKNSAYFINSVSLRVASAALESFDQELANEAKQKSNEYLKYSATYIYQNRQEIGMLAALATSAAIGGATEGSLVQTFGPYAMYLGKALSAQKGLLYFSLAAQLAQGTSWCQARMVN